jgi:hypothetical protein
MLHQKKATSLDRAIENELISLQRLDPFAWRQIGGYLGEVRGRVNGFLAMAETQGGSLDTLCASIKEVDELFEEQIERRVLRLLIAIRMQLGKRVKAGSVDLSPIMSNSEYWPKVQGLAFPPIESAEEATISGEEMFTTWAKNGFPID